MLKLKLGKSCSLQSFQLMMHQLFVPAGSFGGRRLKYRS